MEDKQKFPFRKSYGKMLTASLFILAGLLLFARNAGILAEEWFDLLMAWHSLLIIAGVYTITRRRYLPGTALLLAGIYLLGGKLMLFPDNSQAMFWPLILILTGVFVISPHRKHRERHGMRYAKAMSNTANARMRAQEGRKCRSEDGFLYSDSSFSAVRHVVLNELFKGGDIHAYFGGVVIDLRHTHIAPGETYIDLDCNWGGIELFVPSEWEVQTACNCFCGGCEDKRWKGKGTEPEQGERVLVIRGNVSFGGIEIKD